MQTATSPAAADTKAASTVAASSALTVNKMPITYDALWLANQEIPFALFGNDYMAFLKAGELTELENMLCGLLQKNALVFLRASAFLTLAMYIHGAPLRKPLKDLDFLIRLPEAMYKEKIANFQSPSKKLPVFVHGEEMNSKMDVTYVMQGGDYKENDTCILTAALIPILQNKAGHLVMKFDQKDEITKTFFKHMRQNPPFLELTRISYGHERSSGYYAHLFKVYYKLEKKKIGLYLRSSLFDDATIGVFAQNKYYCDLPGFYRELIKLILTGHFAEAEVKNVVTIFVKTLLTNILYGVRKVDERTVLSVMSTLYDSFSVTYQAPDKRADIYAIFWLHYNLQQIFRYHFPEHSLQYLSALPKLMQVKEEKEVTIININLQTKVIQYYKKNASLEEIPVQQSMPSVQAFMQAVAAGNAVISGQRTSGEEQGEQRFQPRRMK